MESLIKKLLSYQRSDGGFEIFLGCDLVYFTAFILSELNDLPDNKRLIGVKQQAAVFLLSRKQNNFIFSKNILKNFLVISALFKYDSKIFDGESLGEILKQLISLEQEVGGPYYNQDKKTIDLATNLQIAYFLSLNKVELPKLNNFIEQAIVGDKYDSGFYTSAFPSIYLLSKFYSGDKKYIVKKFLLNSLEFGIRSDFDYLFCVLALKNFSYDDNGLNRQIELIRERVSPSGVIQCLLIEKFFIYRKEKDNFNNVEKEMEEKIIDLAQKRFTDLSADLQEIAMSEIKRTMTKSDDKQMFLMPYFFWQALGEKGNIFSEDFVAELGLINVFFWNAFIIYDDFWDEEGVPKKLPTANLFAREFTQFFSLILEEKSGFGKIFRETMNKLDKANTWETLYCRAEIVDNHLIIPSDLPDYGDYTIVFEPASAHMFGSMIMLYKLGYDFSSREMENLIKYFKNYLIAMQINDDANDWEEDIGRGHLSTVVVMIIQEYLRIYPEVRKIDLKEMNELKTLYYKKIIKKMCNLVIRYTTKSRAALLSLGFIERKEYLDRVIVLAEQVARETLVEQKEIKRFLISFNGG